ncbi:hypothetical protein [Prosthecobacter sp.]|uniref:hypothetical protein n=1 Tax=Prosthecobacter sp. TaxID=1965333 RepID=UPI002AB988F3|nr:hypothetical protein [Prosthecobacter sp.]MDZ4405295.1 hypothetical protein [Prosthecobacter sp.]
MSALQTITDDLLIEAINGATQRIVMIGPGVWPPLAKAIAKAWLRLGPKNVTVILDVDPEICRMGYGSLEGLEVLQKAASAAAEPLGGEPGVRICVVIADDQTFVFSPTPRQLEAPPGQSPVVSNAEPQSQPKANGIVLTKPPAALEADLGSGPDGVTTRTLGLDVLDQKKLEAVQQDLKQNPPKNFDLARAVNVYNARIQFVELHVDGYRVSQHTVALPKHLVSVARKNKELARKIASAVKLLDSEDLLVGGGEPGIESEQICGPFVSQATVEAVRNAIDEKFLRPVKGVGKIIRRAQIDEFKTAVTNLEHTLAIFSHALKQVLAALFRKTAEEIADAILPDVLQQLPEKWQKQLGPTPRPEHVRFRVIDDLLHSFGDPEKRCEAMKVSFIFKDVTYDMLKDDEFVKLMDAYFNEPPMLEEYSAAKERPAAQDTQKDLFS